MGAGRKIKCANCGDVIQSMYTHDFVPCGCGSIFVDGGGSYTRVGGNSLDILFREKENWVSLEETNERQKFENIEIPRESATTKGHIRYAVRGSE